VHGIWEAGFNSHAAAAGGGGGGLLPGLHASVMREIRESGAFPEVLRAGVVHRCGLMHRVVEQRRAGWVTHWRELV
jgi:hypothetical protein